MAIPELVVIASSDQPAAPCAVCGEMVDAGAGVAALFHGRLLRFRCLGCLSRFAVDPDHYLVEGPASCCDGEAGHEAMASDAAIAASEWTL